MGLIEKIALLLSLVISASVAAIMFAVVRKQFSLIQELTDKLMARDFREYQAAKILPEVKKKKDPKAEEQKKYIDPVLGAVF